MIKDISLKDLQLIRLAAEEGSLTSAARKMHVSQPAASQRLAHIQSRIGGKLFQRRDGVMRPTEICRRLLQTAIRIEQELKRTWDDLEVYLDPSVQQLRVATQCYTSYRWLPFVLREMHQMYSALQLDVLPEATETPYQALSEERIDVALVYNRLQGFRVDEHELFEDEMFAVMHNGHDLASRQYLNPTNFQDQTLVLYTGDRHAIVEDLLRPAGVSPARIMQVRMTEAIVELVRAGLGIAVLSGWAFDDIENKEELCKVRISRSGYIRQWYAITRRDELPDYQQHFIQLLQKIGPVIHQHKWRKAISHFNSGRKTPRNSR